MTKIHFELISQKATLPKKATPGSAGLDIRAAVGGIIPPHQVGLVKTHLKMRLKNRGLYARLASRSGLALHNQILVGGGVKICLLRKFVSSLFVSGYRCRLPRRNISEPFQFRFRTVHLSARSSHSSAHH